MNWPYRPMPGIWMDPGRQFGTACIEGDRVPARSLYCGGESPREVARWYQVPLRSVIEARLYRRLRCGRRRYWWYAERAARAECGRRWEARNAETRAQRVTAAD